MRIIKGKLKSRRFDVPKSFPSRPTTDFAKEALFSVLEHRIDFSELKILDLCAGTGNISFEFASREAGSILSVDQNYNCIKFIRETAEKFEISQDINTVKADVLKFVQQTKLTFDIIFADPPFKTDFHRSLLQSIFDHQLLNEGGWVVIEHGKETDLSDFPNFHDIKKYGNVLFSFFTY